MARDVVALVSSDDLVAAVRVHADRVHDLLLRGGVAPEVVLRVAAGFMVDLITALDGQPDQVGDLAGWWFGRCLTAVSGDPFGAATVEPAPTAARSLLSGTDAEVAVRRAVAALPGTDRLAVMLRDAYDLPVEAVAVALGRSVPGSTDLIASARLHLFAAHSRQGAGVVGEHTGRTPVDLAALSAVADGSAEPATVLSTRRHVEACGACEETLERLSRARRLALGLTVVAMSDADRESLIEAARERAEAVLPSEAVVLAAAAADSTPHVPVLVVSVAIVLAAVLGVGIGVLSRHGAVAQASATVPLRPLPALPPLDPPPSSSSPPTRSSSESPRATLPPLVIRTSISTPPPTTSSAPPPTTSSTAPTSSSPVLPAAEITLDPDSGPNGTPIDVTGQGFDVHATVSVTFDGGERTVTTSDGSGDFSVSLTADGVIPGSYTVRATDGTGTGTATSAFDQTG